MTWDHKVKPVKLVRKRLDDAGVGDHVAWLAEHAQAIEIRIKGAATSYSDATTDELRDMGRQLVAGTVAAVQVRFYYDDAWWCDTLLRARDSYRMVRMKQLGPDD